MGLGERIARVGHRTGVELTGRVDRTLDGAADAEFTVGAEVSNVINVAVQLKDGNGDDITQVVPFRMYISDDAAGLGVGAAPSVGTAIGTEGTILIEHTTNLLMDCLSNASGVADFDIEDANTVTQFVVIETPGGLIVSEAIAWA